MFSASIGGRDAARTVYRHALVRALIPTLAPLSTGYGWSPLALALGAVLMSLDAGPTLAQRFESVLAVLDRALPRRRKTGRTYQGLVKALARHADAIISLLTSHLRTMTIKAAGADVSIGRWTPIGVDGSKFDAPRTVANKELGIAGKDKSGPQMVLLLLVHLGAMLPWGWAIGNARDSERMLLRRTLHELPRNTLLVADAGFTGFELLSELRDRGMSFLIRVGRGVHLLRALGHYRREGKHTVYLWPNDKHNSEPLVLRLVAVGRACLITDVTDPRELSRGMASDLYRRRWGLEVAFRSIKQTLERRKMRSCAPSHARIELAFAVIGLWTLMLLGAGALRSRGIGPRRLSVAATLQAVRHAMHTNPSRPSLHGRLRRCTMDTSKRRSQRAAYRWPHKKNPPQPGPPSITTATRSQVSAARALRTRQSAA